MSIFGISVSGLNAASTRLSVSASNIANQNSTATLVNGQVVNQAYKAQKVQQVSNQLGGVSTVVRDNTPPTVTVFNPTDPAADPATGLVDVPNVDQAEEMINQMIASYDYKANLKAIKTRNELFDSLLDIKT